MIYPNENGNYPSLHVEDGETVTISAKDTFESGIPILKMRPRTTAALLTLVGQSPLSAPRLSDCAAFEQIDEIENFVNLNQTDEDGRIAGFSIPYLRGVLEALDPNMHVPPRLVKRQIPIQRGDKDCKSYQDQPLSDFPNTSEIRNTTQALAPSPNSMQYISRESVVPDFLAELRVYGLVTALSDVIVGRDATLILDSDIFFAMADNFFAYKGARIIQRAPYLNLDVSGTMRGSLLNPIFTITDFIKVDWQALALELPTKP